MLNLQPPEAQHLDPLGTLDVIKVWKTLQGEGPFAGRPAVFVRLAGCNQMCPACDQDYTTGRHFVKSHDLVNEVNAVFGCLNHEGRLVVLTGGEPFRQKVGPFVNTLLDRGYRVQVETNGGLFDPSVNASHVWFTIVCSPKTSTIRPEMVRTDCYKYVVEAGKVCPDDGLPLSVLGKTCRVARPPTGFPREKVYVQAMDPGTNNDPGYLQWKDNVEQAVEVCMKFGYTFSYQIHKAIGLE